MSPEVELLLAALLGGLLVVAGAVLSDRFRIWQQQKTIGTQVQQDVEQIREARAQEGMAMLRGNRNSEPMPPTTRTGEPSPLGPVMPTPEELEELAAEREYDRRMREARMQG